MMFFIRYAMTQEKSMDLLIARKYYLSGKNGLKKSLKEK